ncbi:MAG: hypothetical protein UMV23_01425 [Halanaerobium sp.]|nr:hypothetical protein [Halanaerobium sp.]
MERRVVGVAGLAKNTGKTTAISCLLRELNKDGCPLAVTTIGYDGEELDNVTGLPKPRVYLQEGNIFATAHSCLQQSSVKATVRQETDIFTPLGMVVVAEVLGAGNVILAGPQTASGLKQIITILQGMGSKIILVDGALNRLVPMIAVDVLVLATGAARNTELTSLTKEIETISRLFLLPEMKGIPSLEEEEMIVCWDGEICRRFNSSSLLSREQLNQIKDCLIRGGKYCYIPGAVSQELLFQLLTEDGLFRNGRGIIIHDIFRLLIGGHLVEYFRPGLAELLLDRLYVLHQVDLLAITVNPFFPDYRIGDKDYQPEYVDGDRLKEKISAVVELPVIDIEADGCGKLVKYITTMVC